MDLQRNIQEQEFFDVNQSKWHGKYKGKTLRIAFCIYNNDYNLVSIPISSISAYIRKYNTNIEIKLFHIIQINDEEKYLPAGFASYLKNWNPDLFAISILSPHWDGVKPYLVEIKRVLPEILILVGGYQAILESDETISFPPIDFLCNGDGEVPTSNLIKYLRGEINIPVNGLWEKLKDGTIYKTPKFNLEDLTTIPFPDYEIYEVNGKINVTYLMTNCNGKRLLPVMIGRGCMYSCTYCSNSTLRKMWINKRTFIRRYDIDSLVNELIMLRDKYNVEYFEFWDELFFADVSYTLDLFEQYQNKVGIPFSIGSRIELMDQDLCRKAADAGCDAIFFGIESGNEEYRRKYLNRVDGNQQILDAVRNCKMVGIKVLSFNIIGLPYETKAEMLETLELNIKIDPESFYIFTYIPLKGTKLYEIAEKAGLLYESLKTVHYVDGMYNGKAKMNIKQIGESATENEFNEVCKLMVDFHNTRKML